MKGKFVSHERLLVFINKVLLNSGVRRDVAEHVAKGLVQASLRGVDSHGIRLFPHYMASVKAGG